jgi:hypothetical protein
MLEELSILNKDIQSVANSKPQTKTVIVKHREVINGGGFFETQVDVIEKEEIIQVPINEDTKKPGKDERIFAFSGFSDFRSKYFTKEVDPTEELSRLKSIKDARHKYAKRFNGGGNPVYNQ